MERHDQNRARILGYLRCCTLIVCSALAPSAYAIDAAFLQLPGITGPFTGTLYSGWFEVAQEVLVLVPGVYDAEMKTARSSCMATLRTGLGAAGATVAQLVGAEIGNVKIERATSSGIRFHQVVLRKAVLTQHVLSFDNGRGYDTLSFRFDAADITTYDVKPDGSRGSGVQGSFNCLAAP